MSAYFTIRRLIFDAATPRELPDSLNLRLRRDTRLKVVTKLYTPTSEPQLLNTQPQFPNSVIDEPITDQRHILPPARRHNIPSFIICHGNGFPKEVYEPFITELLRHTPVNEILTIDMVHQGQSGLLNREILGHHFAWRDGSRDVAEVIQQLRSLRPEFFAGPVIGVGHSMGGNQLAGVALMFKRLLAGYVGVEAIILNKEIGIPISAARAMRRRNWWRSRSEAAEELRKKPFFAVWDKAVFDLYVKYGLRDAEGLIGKESGSNDGSATSISGNSGGAAQPTKPVVLTTSPKAEMASFLTYNGRSNRRMSATPSEFIAKAEAQHLFGGREIPWVYKHLGEIVAGEFGIPALLILGENGLLRQFEPYYREKLPSPLGDVAVMSGGHCLPMEDPAKVAQLVAQFVPKVVAAEEKWAAEEDMENYNNLEIPEYYKVFLGKL